MAAPHTSGGAVATGRARAERPWGAALRPRHTSGPSSRPLHQAGGASCTRQFVSGAGVGPPTPALGDQPRRSRRHSGWPRHGEGAGRQGLGVPSRATTPANSPESTRPAGVSPAVSREAPGAPTRRPDVWRTRCLSKAVLRWRKSSTARARVGARIVSAGPVSGRFSARVSDGGPGAWWRRTRAAACAQAHVRGAVPRCSPAGPTRGPAAACAYVTRRPDETKSCPRGTRSMSWRS
jgi:hypothetical protein